MAPSSPIREEDLTEFPIFSALDGGQAEEARRRARLVRLSRGEHLFRQGDPAHRVWLCRSGQLKLFRLSNTGQERIMAIINAGRSFAEATLFMPTRRYPVHCAALADSDLIGFDSDHLVEILRRDTECCFRLMSTLSRRLHEKIGQIESLSLQNAQLRVAGYLLDEFRRHDQAEVFRLSTSKKHIASLLSIQPETLSRTFAQLQKDGVVEVNARSITVTRPEQLERIVFGGGSVMH